MVFYNLRMALKSLKRNPVLTALMIGGIGLGIGVSTTFVTGFYIFSMDPVPEKSDGQSDRGPCGRSGELCLAL